MNASVDVVVVGAGLSGLAAGATAARRGARVVIVDGHPAGGRARTDDRRGFRFNQGAHALYLGGHAARVLGDLDVGVPSGGDPSTDQWGVAGDLVSPLPFSAGKAVRSKLLDTVGKAQLGRFVLKLRSLDPAPLADRSAEAWLSGLGLRPEATAILRTLAHVASYADDLSAISADAVAAQIKGAVSNGVRYLDGGWQVLVDGLTRSAVDAGADVRIGSPVVAVERGRRRVDGPPRRRHDHRGRGRGARPRRAGRRGIAAPRAAPLGPRRPAGHHRLPRPRAPAPAGQAGALRGG